MLEASSPDILVVEDDDTLRASMAEILQRAGYSVEVAQDGVAALSSLETKAAKVVLLDIKMPRLDGIGFLERAQTPPPVVVVSAVDPEVVNLPVDADVVSYLRKPVRPPELLRVVEAALAPGS